MSRIRELSKSHSKHLTHELKKEKNSQILDRKKINRMRTNRFIEIAVKVVVAALTAFLTAITTTSCMGHGPLAF